MRFRIIALPLATSKKSLSRSYLNNGGPSTLVYYHFQTFPTEPKETRPPGLFKRSMGLAVKVWSGMGKAPEGTWKRNIYGYGERLMDRIDFEETSFKSLHPPESSHATSNQEKGRNTGLRIPLIYPSSLSDPILNFQQLISHRTPFHQKGFWTWLITAPLTAPFAIIPIIPNFPFFFCAWRSWSHWRAWKSSAYLQELLRNNAIVSEVHEELSTIYQQPASEKSTAEKSPEDSDEDRLLLTSSGASALENLFELQGNAQAEILKAMEQTKMRLEKARQT